MRVHWRHTDFAGNKTEGYRDLEIAPLPDSLQDTLASEGLTKLTINRRDGSVMVYDAIEYECRACDGYGHAEASCIPNEIERQEFLASFAGY